MISITTRKEWLIFGRRLGISLIRFLSSQPIENLPRSHHPSGKGRSDGMGFHGNGPHSNAKRGGFHQNGHFKQKVSIFNKSSDPKAIYYSYIFILRYSSTLLLHSMKSIVLEDKPIFGSLRRQIWKSVQPRRLISRDPIKFLHSFGLSFQVGEKLHRQAKRRYSNSCFISEIKSVEVIQRLSGSGGSWTNPVEEWASPRPRTVPQVEASLVPDRAWRTNRRAGWSNRALRPLPVPPWVLQHVFLVAKALRAQ